MPEPTVPPPASASPRAVAWGAIARQEWFLGVSLVTSLIFFIQGPALFAALSNPAMLLVVFGWLFGVALGSIMAVVRHADMLAIRLGEPFGTLILTLSVVAVEVVSISAVTLQGHGDPTLARDTLFAVVMILLNGMIGLALLVGAWRHHEQQYNLQGANAYLGLILPLAVLSLVLPDFTQTTPGPAMSLSQSIFLIVMAAGLYLGFLALQTGRHRGYFMLSDVDEPTHPAPSGEAPPLARHALFLALYMAPVVFLAEQLGQPLDHLIQGANAPAELGGLVIAALVATPEAIGAVRSAFADHLQRAVNIVLGSTLATIGLTVPAVLVIGLATGQGVMLGLDHTDFVLLLLTLAVSVVTFASGRTNVMQGAVHLLLFAAYLLLMFER
ncbi:MAG TPA: ionic transporter y4hA [Caulobacteraceae bacterium]|nr:ionic transporter y4hA [Caulobacteraceae bacterium]